MMRNKRKEPVGNLNCKNSCELVIRILNSLIKKKKSDELIKKNIIIRFVFYKSHPGNRVEMVEEQNFKSVN